MLALIVYLPARKPAWRLESAPTRRLETWRREPPWRSSWRKTCWRKACWRTSPAREAAGRSSLKACTREARAAYTCCWPLESNSCTSSSRLCYARTCLHCWCASPGSALAQTCGRVGGWWAVHGTRDDSRASDDGKTQRSLFLCLDQASCGCRAWCALILRFSLHSAELFAVGEN